MSSDTDSIRANAEAFVAKAIRKEGQFEGATDAEVLSVLRHPSVRSVVGPPRPQLVADPSPS